MSSRALSGRRPIESPARKNYSPPGKKPCRPGTAFLLKDFWAWQKSFIQLYSFYKRKKENKGVRTLVCTRVFHSCIRSYHACIRVYGFGKGRIICGKPHITFGNPYIINGKGCTASGRPVSLMGRGISCAGRVVQLREGLFYSREEVFCL
jgi:hypothetical protein